MIEVVVSNINERIKEAVSYYNTVFGLCEIITKNEDIFPAIKIKNEYKNVTDFDKQVSTLYHRLNGDITIENVEDEDVEFLTVKSYPIRLISVIKRSALKGIDNDGYQDLIIGEQLLNIITGSYNQLAKENKVESINVECNKYSVDRNSLINSEFKIKNIKFDYNYSIVALDYIATIGEYKKCNVIKSC